MEFKVLSGQHMTSYFYENVGSNDVLNSYAGAAYVGQQIKITTTGERAIIYKKKDKHPYYKDKYVYSYFLLGDGVIESAKYCDLFNQKSVELDGWGYPALDDEDITQLQISNIMDWDLINNPTTWNNLPFTRISNNFYAIGDGLNTGNAIYGGNLSSGTKLSSELSSTPHHSPFFGFPVSLDGVRVYPPLYTALNQFYKGDYSDYFPSNSYENQTEYWYKSTLLWNSDGSLTDYGRQFVGYSNMSAYDLFSMLDSSSYLESGTRVGKGSFTTNKGNIFGTVYPSILFTRATSPDGVYATGRRLGSTSMDSIIENMGEEYMFVGIYVTENLEDGKKYVKTGEVPDDATKNDDVSPKTDEDKTDNENGDDNSKKDEQKINNPENTALNSGSTSYFYMNASGVNSFIKWFWNDTGDIQSILTNYITNMYGELKECISGVYHFPCPLTALSAEIEPNKKIVIGRYDTGLTASCLKTPPKNVLLGKVNLSNEMWKRTKSFLDYEGYTTISLYLPYLGVVELPTKTVQNTTLEVYYAVDVPSMQLKYTVKSDGLIVHEQVIKFGDEVPISLSSGLQTVTNTVSAVTGVVTDVAMVGAVGGGSKGVAGALAHTVGVAHTTTDGISVRSSSSGVMGKWGSLKCALIVTKPISKRPSNYAKIKGNLICDTYKLSSLTGLTICENPRITFTNAKPTEKEIEEIYSYLEKGVIL